MEEPEAANEVAPTEINGKRTPVLMLNAYNKSMVDNVAAGQAIVIRDRTIAEKVAAQERDSLASSKHSSRVKEENGSAVNPEMTEAVVA